MNYGVFTVPNAMTLLRVLLTVPLVHYILEGEFIWALGIFFLGLLTDAEGSVARYLNQQTKFGEYFDPIADFLFIGGAFIALTSVGLLDIGIVLTLILVNIPRVWLIARTVQRTTGLGSTLASKLTGIATLALIPYVLLSIPFVEVYGLCVVVFTAVVLAQKWSLFASST
jgi:cardiolipin synthase